MLCDHAVIKTAVSGLEHNARWAARHETGAKVSSPEKHSVLYAYAVMSPTKGTMFG